MKNEKKQDHHAAEKARDRIDTALDNHGVKNLVFDFTNVSLWTAQESAWYWADIERWARRKARLP